MPRTKKPAGTVTIGGKKLTYAKAAFIALEADRLHVVPRDVPTRFALPDPLPLQVELAGQTVSLEAAAAIAEAADQQGTTPGQLIKDVLAKRAVALADQPPRSRRRGEKRPLVGTWMTRDSH